MEKFLETCNLSRLNQEEVENVNRPITSKEIESVIKNLPMRKAQDQMASLVNSTKHLKKNTNPSQALPKIQRGGNTPKLILWRSEIL